MPWKMIKDLKHPMWGRPYVPTHKSRWPSIKELSLPPKPPAPEGFTYTWTDDTKTSLNNKIPGKK